MVQFSKILGVSFLILGFVCLKVCSFVPVTLFEWGVWSSNNSGVDFAMLFDLSSVLFSSTVLLIAGSVLIYCSWYMDDEVFYKRFVYLVLLFVSSMIFLIFIPNLICLLIGWDGLGITSFLLVVFYQNNKSLGAGMVTALVNRIGDVLLLVSISLLASEGSWLLYNNSVIVANVEMLPFILMIGAITKSAQMPFSAWLPAAMAAPTPVSSLVHSSTLVTAGVYLIYRSSSIITMNESAMSLLKVLSVVTLVMAGSSALVEVDLKKVIALSTLSQLSMMLFSLSLSFFALGFFHLITHASFKALLFLCAGVVIHSNKKFQDIRFLGKSWSVLPLSMACFVVANMSLCGVPFFSGFYSKDMIIEACLCSNESLLIYFLLVTGTLFTSLYSIRVGLNLLFGFSKSSLSAVFLEEKTDLKLSYLSLLVSSILLGWTLSCLFEELYVSFVLNFFDKSMASLFLFLAAMIYFVVMSLEGKKYPKSFFWFLGLMWNLKWLTTQAPSGIMMKYSDYVVCSLEKGWIEKVGPQGVFDVLKVLGRSSQTYQQYPFLLMTLLSFSIMVLILGFSVVI